MTGWWKRNAVALCALAVLLPVTAGAVVWDRWQDYNLYRHTIPIDVADGGTLDLVDATWGPVRVSEIVDTSGFDMPADAQLVAAVIPVEVHGEPPYCPEPTLVQQSTGARFTQIRTELGLEDSHEEPTRCFSDGEDPVLSYEMIVPFVVPEDADGPFWVEIVPDGASPSVIRFSIDP